MASFVQEAVEACRKQVGKNKVVLALSGGVDSMVVAALLHKAIGDQLYYILLITACFALTKPRQLWKTPISTCPGLTLKW